jgi:hypothetical protein
MFAVYVSKKLFAFFFYLWHTVLTFNYIPYGAISIKVFFPIYQSAMSLLNPMYQNRYTPTAVVRLINIHLYLIVLHMIGRSMMNEWLKEMTPNGKCISRSKKNRKRYNNFFILIRLIMMFAVNIMSVLNISTYIITSIAICAIGWIYGVNVSAICYFSKYIYKKVHILLSFCVCNIFLHDFYVMLLLNLIWRKWLG